MKKTSLRDTIAFILHPSAFILSLSGYLTYLAVRVSVCILQTCTLETCRALARACAPFLATHVRSRIVDENLRSAFPAITNSHRARLAVQMWEHLLLLLAEVAHAPRKIHETNWRDYVSLENAGLLTRLLLSERPVLIVSAHFGNFELAGFLLGILGFPTHTVARTLDNPRLDAFLNRFRGAHGQHIVPKRGGYEQILDVLARAGTMTFLADQYAGSKGCWVRFFDRPASTHKAIALFALDKQAPLAVGYAVRLGCPLRYKLVLDCVADPLSQEFQSAGVRELTQWYTSKLEAAISQFPQQYWWLHRRWKDNRPARRRHAA